MENIKEKLIEDMLIILFNTEGISSYSINHIIDMYCWVITERMYGLYNSEKTKNTKYAGCKYWSQKALEKYDKSDVADEFTNENKKSISKYKGLKHEHVVPRNLFRAYIKNLIKEYKGKNLDEETKSNIINKINNCFIGCVVTSEEAVKIDKSFKDNFPDNIISLSSIEKENMWNRYKDIDDIKIFEVTWGFCSNRWKILDKTEINI